jgi:hypothetical protein
VETLQQELSENKQYININIGKYLKSTYITMAEPAEFDGLEEGGVKAPLKN